MGANKKSNRDTFTSCIGTISNWWMTENIFSRWIQFCSSFNLVFFLHSVVVGAHCTVDQSFSIAQIIIPAWSIVTSLMATEFIQSVWLHGIQYRNWITFKWKTHHWYCVSIFAHWGIRNRSTPSTPPRVCVHCAPMGFSRALIVVSPFRFARFHPIFAYFHTFSSAGRVSSIIITKQISSF